MTSLKDGLVPFRGDFPRTEFPSAASTSGALLESPIQECELAEDIIKVMSLLIHGLTFKSPGSLRAVLFWPVLLQSISYYMI